MIKKLINYINKLENINIYIDLYLFEKYYDVKYFWITSYQIVLHNDDFQIKEICFEFMGSYILKI